MAERERIETLRRQGVSVPAPESVEIGEEVKLEQIRGPGTVLHAGTKLFGADLVIMPGARLGYEEPVTVESCAVGRAVKLAGGYFAGGVFLDRVVMAKGSQVRSGTLMEEESNGAHCVGLKQTILMPFVTMGSLINFCDILMAGGTSRRDHSEVGSSFIHFNFTPFGKNGDKATPSLIGDVPRGVMLRSPRIFLGGQAGLVGPISIDYGTVLAAGAVYRRDYGPGQLVVGEALPPRTMPFTPLRYGRIRGKVEKNLRYIGNLIALWHWYSLVRLGYAALRGDSELALLYTRGRAAIEECIAERIKRLGQIAGYMEDSVGELERDGGAASVKEIADQRAFGSSWPTMERRLLAYPTALGKEELGERASFHAAFERAAREHASYLELIKALPGDACADGTMWLSAIVTATEQVIF
jgi:UDP-N-acetylglucosamine/UDP-N-acetylgalactosamine diphosphorylase